MTSEPLGQGEVPTFRGKDITHITKENGTDTGTGEFLGLCCPNVLCSHLSWKEVNDFTDILWYILGRGVVAVFCL